MGHKVVPGSVDDALAEEPKPAFFPHLKFQSGGPYPPVLVNPSTVALWLLFYYRKKKLFSCCFGPSLPDATTPA